ncbi:MAG: PqqD family protein [Acidobacteria bacterium]|nr:PqqD family protein [Acidobacteriota bacterium]
MSGTRSSTVIFRKKGETVIRRIAGETLLVPLRGDVVLLQKLFVLNPGAEVIWDKLDGRTELGTIAAVLADRFGIAPDQAAADTRDFIQELLTEGLVEEVALPG